MKRTLSFVVAFLAAAALFSGLVHAVLVAMHLSKPAATTVYGLTPGRLWATAAAALALAGAIMGGLALRRSNRRVYSGRGRKEALAALVAGTMAAINGGLNLVMATGGPGTGNGVVGGAAALVLGLIAMILGGLARSRFRRAEEPLT